MTMDLREMLVPACRGNTAYAAMGNTDRGDDGAGVALARLLLQAGIPDVFDGGTTPEKLIPCLRDGGFESIVFLDAADLGSAPGTVAVLDAGEITARYPQISTHKMSVAALARLACDGNGSHPWLIGIQPQSIKMDGQRLSGPVDATIHLLAQCIAELTVPVTCRLEEQLCS